MPLGDLAAAPRDYREAGSWVDAIGHEKLGWA
jgi:hypothetical protein